MKKFLTVLEYYLDYYIGWMFYNGNKIEKYNNMMKEKWGEK